MSLNNTCMTSLQLKHNPPGSPQLQVWPSTMLGWRLRSGQAWRRATALAACRQEGLVCTGVFAALLPADMHVKRLEAHASLVVNWSGPRSPFSLGLPRMHCQGTLIR